MTETVFISYAKEDKAPVERLYFELRKAGVTSWLDSFDLIPGQLWEKQIEEAISHSSYFIAALSSRSVGKRGHVQKEIRQALDIANEYPEDKLFVIPVRIDECEPSFKALRKLHRVDLFPDYQNGLNSLLRVFGYTTKEKPKLTYIENYRREGTITTLAARGYGFLSCIPIEKDIFFHHAELRGVMFEELRPGDLISFTLASGRSGLAAVDVERV